MSSPHLITRMAFELELQNRQHAPLIQNRVSAFAAGRMHSVLIDSLSLAPAVAEPLVARQVTLNLGEISFARLESDLAAGMARQLREWALRIKARQHPGLDEVRSGLQWQHNEILLPRENHPDSGAESLSAKSDGLNKAVAHALHASEAWPQLASAVRDSHPFRRRLAAEVSPGLLNALVKSLFPDHAAWIAELSSALISLHRIAPLVPASPAAFLRLFWECLLTVLAGESNAHSNRAFAEKLVQILSARHSLRPGVLVSRIMEAAKHASRESFNSGPAMASLKELKTSLAQLDRGTSSSSGDVRPEPPILPGFQLASIPATETAIENLDGFLQWGIWTKAAAPASDHTPQSEINTLMANSPDKVCALIRRLAEIQVVRRRIARQFPENTLQRVMFGLDPINTRWMVQCMKQLRRLHAQQPLLALHNRDFGALLWELALEHLSEHGWNAKNGVSFLRFVLQRIALRRQVMYELLLAELSIRRDAEVPRRQGTGNSAPQSSLNATIIFLLDNDVLGIHGQPPHLQRFAVQPRFHHLYSDLDVLAYWLRWRKVPDWCSVSTPEQLAGYIGPLLPELPADIRNGGEMHSHTTSGFRDTKAGVRLTGTPAAAVQIEYWLLYGTWPAAVDVARSAALTSWLESRQTSDWLVALRHCGAQQHAMQRLTSHLPPQFLLKITSALAGPHGKAVCGYVRALQALGATLRIACSPPWAVHVSRYTLAHLLKLASPPSLKELAMAALPALSLRCQVSYERLLLLLREETRGHQGLQNLCDELDAEFHRCASNPGLISLHSQPFGPAPSPLAVVPVISKSACDSDRECASRLLPRVGVNAGAFATSLPSKENVLGERLRFVAKEECMELEGTSAKDLAPEASVSASAERRLESDAWISRPNAYRAAASYQPLCEITGEKRSRAIRSEASLGLQFPDLTEPSKICASVMPPKEKLGLGNDAKFSPRQDNQRIAIRRPTAQGSDNAEGRSERLISVQRIHPEPMLATIGSTPSHGTAVVPNEHLARVNGSHPSELDHHKAQTATRVQAHAENADRGRTRDSALENSIESRDSSPSDRFSSGSAAGSASAEQTTPVSGSGSLKPTDQSGTRTTLASAGNKTYNQRHEQLEGLEHLLLTGNLPGSSYALTSPARAWLGALLQSEPEALLAMLRKVASSAQSIGRLVRYVRKSELSGIIGAAAPEFGGLFILYIEAATGFAGETRLSCAQHARISGLHWRETLRFLLDQNAPISTSVRSLCALCCRVAQQLGLAADQYLEIVTQAAAHRAATESKYAALVHVLQQMKPGGALEKRNSSDRGTTHEAGELISHATMQSSGNTPTGPQTTLSGDRSVESQAALPDVEVREGIQPEKDLELPDEESGSGRLEYFLRYGELPPAYARQSLTDFMENVVEPLIGHSEICQQEMRRVALCDLERKRIARFFSSRALKLLWPLLLPARHVHADVALDELCAAAIACAPGIQSQRVREICIETLLSTVPRSPGHRWDIAAYFRLAIEHLAKEHSLSAIEVIEQLRRRLYRRTREMQEELGRALDRVERETAVIPIPMRAPDGASMPPPRGLRPTRHPKPLPSGEPFYVSNAGVILLWPFLSRYFESLGLLQQNSFRGEKERSRAVYLVQYLASGRLEAPEHELLLNKILCGMQPEQPLETVMPLTETEEALSAHLLHSVILNWEKLRNTSIDGLRHSFLLRDGRLLLRKSDGAWSLDVSTRAYDILLDTLPWRLSMVRLPWMLTMLHVKWR